MWHGLSDAAILATSSIGYYQGREADGRPRATQDFFRLFLVPGVHHCAGGPGLTEFDALTLLENWVEKGQAPDVMIASRSERRHRADTADLPVSSSRATRATGIQSKRRVLRR